MHPWRQDRVHFAEDSEWGDETAHAADEAVYDDWDWDAADDGAEEKSYAGDFDGEAAYYGEDPAE
jgi:hypothetical protein